MQNLGFNYDKKVEGRDAWKEGNQQEKWGYQESSGKGVRIQGQDAHVWKFHNKTHHSVQWLHANKRGKEKIVISENKIFTVT